MFSRLMGTKRHTPDNDRLRCSFCNKDQDAVKKLIAGPTVFICDECIQVCNDILADRESLGSPPAEPPAPAEPVTPTTEVVTCALCGMRLPWEEAVLVPARGALCPGCTGEIEAALALKHESGG